MASHFLGELVKLVFEVSERIVSRYIVPKSLAEWCR